MKYHTTETKHINKELAIQNETERNILLTLSGKARFPDRNSASRTTSILTWFRGSLKPKAEGIEKGAISVDLSGLWADVVDRESLPAFRGAQRYIVFLFWRN